MLDINKLIPLIPKIDYEIYSGKRNGLKLLFFYNENYTSIYTNMIINCGSINENDNNRGIAHVLEHLVFKGTKNYPDIIKSLELLGALYNASTGFETTNYSITTLSLYQDEVIDIILDIFMYCLFPEEEIKKELDVIIQEYLLNHDNKNWLGINNLIKIMTMNNNTEYNCPPIGKLEIIKKITRKDVLEFYKNYRYDISTLIIYGKYNRNKILELVSKKTNDNYIRIKNYNPTKYKFIKPFSNFIDERICRVKHDDGKMCMLCIGFPAVEKFHKYTIYLSLINNILSGGPSSRLFKLLRIDNNLAYSFDSDYIGFNSWGLQYIMVHCEKKKVCKVYKLIIKEINNIIKNNFTESEVDLAKDNLYTKLLISYNTPMNIANTYINLVNNNKKLIVLDKYFNYINNISYRKNSIQKIFSLIFKFSDMYISIIN